MPPRQGRQAARVAAGILLSRLTGLVRQRVFARYLGLSDAADVVAQSFRIPNLLQNLFGEGVLSASFIPVYARLLGEGKDEDANRVAGAVAGLLGLVVSLIVALGIATTPLVVTILAPGFADAKRELTITLVRILFPATGLLVFSAWCLGVLNSHRHFFLSYVAPVVWNAAIVTAVLVDRHTTVERLAVIIAWGAVAGSLLQVLVQLPTVRLLVTGLRLTLGRGSADVATVVRNFWPALVGRGVNQISAYVDSIIATLLGTGAAMAVANAATLYTLPASIFGMSISAAELPEMSSATGNEAERHAVLRSRLESGLHRIAFFIVPCAVAFVVLGQVIAGAIFQSGRFTAADSRYVWGILAGSAIGLLASTSSRLSSSTFYALGDTKTPLRYALIRVTLTTVLGYVAAVWLPPVLGVELRWGAVGLTVTAGFAAWIEFVLLRNSLAARIGPAPFGRGYLFKLWSAALVAGGAGWGAWQLVGGAGPLVAAAVTLVPFGVIYGAITLLWRIPTAREVLTRGLGRA